MSVNPWRGFSVPVSTVEPPKAPSTYRWATVTDDSPLSVQFDGDTSPMAGLPEDLVGGLAVGDRVWCQLYDRRVYLLGKAHGSGGVPKKLLWISKSSSTMGSIGTSTWTDLKFSTTVDVNEDGWTSSDQITFTCPVDGLYSIWVQPAFTTAPPAAGNAYNAALTVNCEQGLWQAYNHIPYGANDLRTFVTIPAVRMRAGIDNLKTQIRAYGFAGACDSAGALKCQLRVMRIG